MSLYFRIREGLLIALVLFGLGDPACAAPLQRPAPRDPRQLLPLERQFLELEVDLGQPAPFPWQTPVATTPVNPREVAGHPPVVPPSTPMELGLVKWRRDFESAKRRPIETVIFGKGPQRIVVLSSLTGNSEATVALIEKLAGVIAFDELTPVQLSVLVVRTPNPDGLADRTLTNSRGVDLNRNFPSSRFTASPRRETGEKPGSEPETRALIQLLNQFNPTLVVHVVESRSLRGTIRSDDHFPREFLPQYDSARFDQVYKAGSLAGYVHETMKCSFAEVELPSEFTVSSEEDALLQLMISILDQSSRSLRSQLESRRSLAQPAPMSTRETGQVRPDGLRGNVEFLPPPPGTGPAIPRKRFIELPPPPVE